MDEKHLSDVRRYDKDASEETVGKIVKHLGIAVRGKDSSLVSCSDTAELDRVRQSWCMRKLGESDASRCDDAIGRVCETMRGDTRKQRVTFYYLTAKELGGLDKL